MKKFTEEMIKKYGKLKNGATGRDMKRYNEDVETAWNLIKFEASSEIFAVRSEFLDGQQSPEYIKGYIKGVCSALADLGLPDETVSKTRENMRLYRQWVLDDEPIPEDKEFELFEEWIERKGKKFEESEEF